MYGKKRGLKVQEPEAAKVDGQKSRIRKWKRLSNHIIQRNTA